MTLHSLGAALAGELRHSEFSWRELRQHAALSHQEGGLSGSNVIPRRARPGLAGLSPHWGGVLQLVIHCGSAEALVWDAL